MHAERRIERRQRGLGGERGGGEETGGGGGNDEGREERGADEREEDEEVHRGVDAVRPPCDPSLRAGGVGVGEHKDLPHIGHGEMGSGEVAYAHEDLKTA
jgi:hypothetical protein